MHKDQVREALQRQHDGRAMIRILMNTFFSKEELKSGSLLGTGKGQTLDGEIVEAVLCK